jgi:hypothetical protein
MAVGRYGCAGFGLSFSCGQCPVDYYPLVMHQSCNIKKCNNLPNTISHSYWQYSLLSAVLQGTSKRLYLWKLGWISKQDLTAWGFLSGKNYHVFIWIHKQAGSVATILLIGMKISPHKHSQAWLGRDECSKMLSCKLFLTTVKTVNMNKIVPTSRMTFSHTV